MTVLSAVALVSTLFIDEFDMNTEMDNERSFENKEKVEDVEKEGH
jgi:hypothetical protein